jgi:hypothetical protein
LRCFEGRRKAEDVRFIIAAIVPSSVPKQVQTAVLKHSKFRATVGDRVRLLAKAKAEQLGLLNLDALQKIVYLLEEGG